jgi:hypothetical protein
MTQEFIPYEQALALKELGFDEPCFAWYQDDTLMVDVNANQSIKFHEHLGRFKGFFLAPLYQQAFRWFREKYGLNAHIHQENRNNYSYCCGQGYSDEIGGYQDFDSYEEAELECLKKLIEILKTKNKNYDTN